MAAAWRVRQYSCIDAAGRVVDIRPKKGIGVARVIGWRVRWDAPGYAGRSRTFVKSKHPTPTEAFEESRRFVEALEAAATHDWPADRRGRPAPPVAPSLDVAVASGATLGLAELATEWITAAGGKPKTVQQHESSVAFLLSRLPEGIEADEVTSAQAQDALLSRRFTPSHRARKLIRMGVLDPDDDRGRMCGVETEKVFLQDVRNLFAYGAERKPSVVRGNPFAGFKARTFADEPADPSLEITFPIELVVQLARRIPDVIFRLLVILRGLTAIRTGEMASISIDDIDQDRCLITVSETAGSAPRRLTPTGLTRTTNHLKQRDPGDDRQVHYPDVPWLRALISSAVDEARKRHRERESALQARLERYRSETMKAHLVESTERELRAHRRTSPLLVTMSDGSPFSISEFDRRVWKPVLHEHFPVTDPDSDEYSPLRETRFYNLRSAAIEFLIEEVEEAESDVAKMAGHSVEMQRRRYRRPRGGGRRLPALDAAAERLEGL